MYCIMFSKLNEDLLNLIELKLSYAFVDTFVYFIIPTLFKPKYALETFIKEFLHYKVNNLDR